MMMISIMTLIRNLLFVAAGCLVITQSFSAAKILTLYNCLGDIITVSYSINKTTLVILRSEEYVGSGGRDLEIGVPDAHKNITSPDYNTTVGILYSVDPVGNTYNLKVNLTMLVLSDGHLLFLDDSNNVKLNVTIFIRSQNCSPPNAASTDTSRVSLQTWYTELFLAGISVVFIALN